MKYSLLTKEQFNELHKEFAQFLATQQVDVNEWEFIKKEKPELASNELEIFSDIVWENVLTKCSYLEHISKNDMNLFKCNSKEIIRIYIKINDINKSFLNPKDFNWFINNPLHNSMEYFKASKKYDKERNVELFELIKMGSNLSDGVLFNQILKLIQ